MSAEWWYAGPKDDDNNDDAPPTTGVAVQSRVRAKKPSLYKVIMLNDDYTPMEFVIMVLERFFNKNQDDKT